MIHFRTFFVAEGVRLAQLNRCFDHAAICEATSDVYTWIKGVAASDISASLFCAKLPGFTQLSWRSRTLRGDVHE